MATTKKSTTKGRLKDPKGGLTAAGRKHFAETAGSHLRPGVKAVKSEEDMRRKGSFLRRHYGHAPSPLKDEHGEPTRYAKQAAAWGEPVPKTKADVAKLARKGTALLDRYHKTVEGSAAKGKATSKAKK